MEQCAQSFDLVLSADVFIYIGDLAEVFDLTARRLCPGGLFAFSIEVDNRIQEFELRHTGRYVQSLAYIGRLAQVCGFEEVYCHPDYRTLRAREAGCRQPDRICVWHYSSKDMPDQNETSPIDAEVIYRRAADSYREGRVAEAEALGRRVLGMDPGSCRGESFGWG